MFSLAPDPDAEIARARSAEPAADQAGFIWRVWLPVAWLLPVLLLLLRFASGGWETLFFLIGAPLWIPAVALLGALPRFIMRRRGFVSAPAIVGALMVASSWGFALFMLAMRGSGDSGTLDSPLREALPVLSERAEGVLSGLGFVLWPAAYAVALVLASVLPAGSGRRGRNWIPALALVATPILAGLVTAAIVAVMHHGPVDGGGDQEADLIGLSQEERMAKQEAYWERTQGAVSPLREAIKADGWLVGESGGVHVLSSGEPESYEILVSWEQRFEEAPVGIGERALAAALATGWEHADNVPAPAGAGSPSGWPDDQPGGIGSPGGERFTDEDGNVTSLRYLLRNAEGYSLTITADLPRGMREARAEGKLSGEPTAAYLRLRVASPGYWMGDESVDWYRIASSDDPATQELWSSAPRSFAAFEWPELAAVEGGWSISYER